MLAAAKEKAKATADAARAKADAAASAATSAAAAQAQRASDAALNAATSAVNTAATSAAPAHPVAAAAVAVGGLGGVAVASAVTSVVAPALMEMRRVPKDEPPEAWLKPTTCWCGAPVMRAGPCATLAKLALLPLALPAYALGVLGWAAFEAWNESAAALLMCVVCPRDAAKAEVWVDAMQGTRFGGAGVRRFARARRAMDPPLSCAEAVAINSHEFMATNGKCWCCTCPVHAHQVHGHCVEAPCQVWLLDSDPNQLPKDAGGEFCACG